MKRILWHCADLSSSEHAVLQRDSGGALIRGTVALLREDEPCRIAYEVRADTGWRTTTTTAVVASGGSTDRLVLTAADGRWTVGGEPAPYLDGCTDVDLGWTPSTNTLPIRRLGPVAADGAEHAIRVALVRFPELDMAAAEQSYARLAPDRWRFRMDDFEAELVVDEPTGLVTAYGTDLWRGTVGADRT